MGSIHATPLTTLVYTGSGRRYAEYMAGIPLTAWPSGCHSPSPGSGCWTIGTIAGGGGRCLRLGAVVAQPRGFPSGPGPGWVGPARGTLGAPPFLGLWWLYQKFSMSLTSQRRWLSLSHSTERTPRDWLLGLVTAAT